MPRTRFLVKFAFNWWFLYNGNCFRIQETIKIKVSNGKKWNIYAIENMAILNSLLYLKISIRTVFVFMFYIYIYIYIYICLYDVDTGK